MATKVLTVINVVHKVHTVIKYFDVICVCNDPAIYAYVSVLASKVNVSRIKDHCLEFVRICEKMVFTIPKCSKLTFLL